jgi:hypothetical protein
LADRADSALTSSADGSQPMRKLSLRYARKPGGIPYPGFEIDEETFTRTHTEAGDISPAEIE